MDDGGENDGSVMLFCFHLARRVTGNHYKVMLTSHLCSMMKHFFLIRAVSFRITHAHPQGTLNNLKNNHVKYMLWSSQ